VGAPPRRRRASLQNGNGNGHRRRRLPRHRGLRIALVALAVFSALGVAGIAVVYAEYQHYRGELPDAATLATMEPPIDTHVYARDGTTLLKIYNDQGFYHEHAALADVSSFAKFATIDTEDRHFYQEGSWDLPRIIK